MKVLCIDTETGGLDPDKHSILSIAAIVGDLDTGEKFETFYTLVKLPSYNVTPKAMEINKLNVDECQKNGMLPEAIADKLMDLWTIHGCSIIAGHNVTFDKSMLASQIFNCSLSEFESNFTYRILDSITMSMLFAGTEAKSGNSLKQLCEAWGIKSNNPNYHNALYDTDICFDLLSKFRRIVFKNPELIRDLQNENSGKIL